MSVSDTPKSASIAQARPQAPARRTAHEKSDATHSRWFLRPGARPGTGVRLFCFPCAGYGAAMYRQWINAHLGELDIYPVQTPGRGTRLSEPAVASLPDLVARLVPVIAPLTDRPYAFFGHSFGAVLAAFTCAALIRSGHPAPAHLFLSARQPPNRRGPVPPLSHLSDADFITEINNRYGGIPAQILDEPDILALLLPALRADIRALEDLEGHQILSLPVPITAYGGQSDAIVSPELMDSWQHWTSAGYRRRLFEGGHFFIESQRDALLKDMSETLAQSKTDYLRWRQPA
ncbi:thioesterase II family protein [Oceaniovalibus sp. ACAM 378]|uniref:thioesterase II family protein n=1 Tax=Oceaniovalibus sp. ACAM 378 TaxID=2599923 RepID=UPI00210434F2|nr:alpha/beta fold hydrolase [Oceaniovalibus sp. ACAM 378]